MRAPGKRMSASSRGFESHLFRSMKKTENKLPICFLITPIGSTDSIDRNRVNQWQKLIYRPAVKGKYKIVRSDIISTPGLITKQIIDNILDAELVIIDFTPSGSYLTPNPNVMYEAAIRHIAKKPVIHITPENTVIPFDIKDFRSIRYSQEDLEYPKKLRDAIKRAIKDINSHDYKTPDIIGHTFDLERIVADPEKFIQILKEKLFANEQKRIQFQNAINYGTSSVSNASLSDRTFFGSSSLTYNLSDTHLCPQCGAIATAVDYLSDHSHTHTQHANAQTSYGVAIERKRQYRCTNCGFLFYI